MRPASSPSTKDPTSTVGSTPIYFSLWDVDSRNSLGTYDTETEAIEIMRLLIEANGWDYASFLDLSRVDETGHEEHVGTGVTLLPELEPRPHRRAN